MVEACRNWHVAVDLIDGLVKEITLAHPLKVRAIAEAKIKTDSIDSETLAQLLRVDLIPQAYLRDKSNQKDQRILRTRSFYVKLRTQIKNRIHYIIDAQGQEEIREGAKGFSDLFGKRGLEWLRSLELSEPDNKLLKNLLETHEVICQKIGQTEWRIKELMAKYRDCQLLKTIPGIGDFLSVLIKVEIGDKGRFRTSSHLCSYAGLVSSTYISGGKGLYHFSIFPGYSKNGLAIFSISIPCFSKILINSASAYLELYFFTICFLFFVILFYE